MSDINFLPSDFKKKEEKEKKRPKPSLSSQMSDPAEHHTPKEEHTKDEKDLLGDVIASLKESIVPISEGAKQKGDTQTQRGETDPEGREADPLKTDLIHPKKGLSPEDVDTGGLSLKSVDDHKGTPAPQGKKGGLFGFLKRQPKGAKILEERVVQGKADPRKVSKDLGAYKEEKNEKKQRQSPQVKRTPNPQAKASQKQHPPQKPATVQKEQKKKDEKSWKAQESSGSEVLEDEIVVNLLPEGQLMPAEIKRRLQVVIISFVASVSVVALVSGLTRWQVVVVNAKNKDLQAETVVLQNKLRVEQSRVEKSQDIITRLMALPVVFDERHVWTNFLARFEALTLKNVYHDFMNVNDTKVSTEVVAPDWKQASEQLSLWQEQSEWWDDLVVTNIRSENVTTSENQERLFELLERVAEKNVKYSLDVTLNKNAWSDLEETSQPPPESASSNPEQDGLTNQ